MQVWEASSGLTYEEFSEKCLKRNYIGLVKGVSHDEEWVAAQWSQDNVFDKNAFKEFISLPKGTMAQVMQCNEEKEEETAVTMSVEEFLDAFETPRDVPLYLKDWHLQELLGEKKFYTVPTFLGTDYLNSYCRHNTTPSRAFGDGSDYRFVYIGSKGSYTPFHVDVFNSFSWSLNIHGVKEWWFVHPDEMPKLGREPPMHWMKQHRQNLADIPRKEKDGYHIAHLPFEGHDVQVMMFTQHSSDLVFVPSGWGHQVWNLESCFSINHNWCTVHNLPKMTNLLRTEVLYLHSQLQDVKDLLEEQHPDGGYIGHCEWLLHNASNWNMAIWTDLLRHTASLITDKEVVAQCCKILAGLPWGQEGLHDLLECLCLPR